MANKGWIKLWRQLADNEIWTAEPFSKGQAWVDLLLMADLDGTVKTSLRELSKRWKWHRNTVAAFLQELSECTTECTTKCTTMVDTKCTTSGTVITIVKWGVYQGQSKKKCTTKCTTVRDTKSGEKCTTVFNNVEEDKKKIKEEKEAFPPAPPLEGVPERYRARFGNDVEAYRRWREQ